MRGIRCALCRDLLSAQLTRKHNNANMLALAGGFTGPFEAEHIVDAFLTTEFEGGRHERRVNLITDVENEQACPSIAFFRPPSGPRFAGRRSAPYERFAPKKLGPGEFISRGIV